MYVNRSIYDFLPINLIESHQLSQSLSRFPSQCKKQSSLPGWQGATPSCHCLVGTHFSLLTHFSLYLSHFDLYRGPYDDKPRRLAVYRHIFDKNDELLHEIKSDCLAELFLFYLHISVKDPQHVNLQRSG